MLPSQILEKLLEEEILPEIEDHIDDLFEVIAQSKDVTAQDREALDDARVLRDDFKAMLEELRSGDMDEEECQEIIEELNEMRQDEEE